MTGLGWLRRALAIFLMLVVLGIAAPVIYVMQAGGPSQIIQDQLASRLGEGTFSVRDVTFDPAYEEKIRKKKLADQEAELNKSRTLAAEMEGKTKKIEAETQQLVKIVKEEKEAEIVRMKADTDLTIATITAEAEEYATKKKADADLVAAEQEAAGQLLIKTEEANGERLRNAAMMGSGGSTIVALEAARNLKLSSVTVSTMDIDLLDIDKMATKLGAAEAK